MKYTTFSLESVLEEAEVEQNEVQVIPDAPIDIEKSEEEETRSEIKKQHKLRDRSKIQKPPRYYDYMACAAIVTEEPKTYEETVSSSEADHWL